MNGSARRGTLGATPSVGAVVPYQRILFGFAAALGGGLLIGIERERRKGFGAGRALAGIRTFSLVSLMGAAASVLAQPLLTFAGAALVLSLAAIGRWRRQPRDPGVTTELALFVTYLLGVMAIDRPIAAAGGSIVVASLLVSRRSLHEFSVDVLTERELRDGLLFAACALIVLPLLPAELIPWLGGASPRRIFALVVAFIGIQAAGYVALRVAGPGLGLALSGLASGFVSSTSTIAALGSRARAEPKLRAACVSGALFSNIATVALLAIVVGAIHPPVLAVAGPSLGAALLAALAAAGTAFRTQPADSPSKAPRGHPFNLLHALGFAAALTGVTAAMTIISSRLGRLAADVAVGFAALFDVHAASASVVSLAAKGAISPRAALFSILVALSANTLTKLAVALATGGRRYGLPVAAGLLAIVAAAWLPLLWIP